MASKKPIDDDILAAIKAASAPKANAAAPTPTPMPGMPAAPRPPRELAPDIVSAVDDAKEAKKLAGISKLKSAWEGVKSGVTLNFGDELAGTAAAIGGKLGAVGSGVDDSFQPSFSENYRAGRDDAREEERLAAKANPKSNLFGNIVGGALLTPLAPGLAPLKALPTASKAVNAVRYLAPLAATGSAFGAVSGAGGAKELSDVPLEVAKGYALGAVGGAAGGAVGAGLSKLAGPLLGNHLRDVADKADELRVLTSSGAHGGSIGPPKVLKEALRVPGGVAETARVMRSTGMAPKLGTTGQIQRAANATNDEANDVIRAVIEGVDDAGVKVDVKSFANQLRAHAKELATRPELDDAAEELTRRAALYEARFPDGVTMRQAQQLVTDLGDRVNWTKVATGQLIPNAHVASAAATRAMRESMDTAATKAFENAGIPEAATKAARIFGGKPPATALDAYKGARRASQVSRIVGDAAEESTNRAAKNRSFGLMDAQAGQLAAAALPAAPGLAASLAIGARKAAASVGATARATGAESVRDILNFIDKNPNVGAALGAAGRGVVAAARSGAKMTARALVAQHLAALERDPGYAKAVELATALPERMQALDSLAARR